MHGSRVRPLTALVLVSALVVGGLSLTYAAWMQPLLEADIAAAEGRAGDALAKYREAEDRLGQTAATRVLFADAYASAVHNQLQLLYRSAAYDALLEKAATAPAGAAPHFWAGLALIRMGMAEGNAQTQVTWFTRAEEELREALRARPDDWDTKVNYEIAARIVSELRRQPSKRSEELMQLLRPQPSSGPAPRKVG
ncbi:MAG TPA: hypothetical protein VM364_20845 [Vicinamibacterales bacterium]|nr:hypothetical protein [Vicinamibacterales bacterium]